MREIERLTVKIDSKNQQFEEQFSALDYSVGFLQTKTKNYEESIQRIDDFLKNLHAEVTKAQKDIQNLKTEKLDKESYNPDIIKIREDIETLKMAAHDNYRNIISTDNYIEKYLPFTILQLCGEMVTSFTEQEDLNLVNGYLDKKYKILHKQILADDGTTHLKKESYNLKGYREIIKEEGLLDEKGTVQVSRFMRRQSIKSPRKKASIIELANICDERIEKGERSPLKKFSLGTNGNLEFKELVSQKNKDRLSQDYMFGSDQAYDPFEKPKVGFEQLEYKLRRTIEGTHKEIEPLKDSVKEVQKEIGVNYKLIKEEIQTEIKKFRDEIKQAMK